MQRLFTIGFTFLLTITIFSCGRVPGDVIDTKTMEHLLVDIHKAEAYMENNKYLANNKSAQDSVKNIIFTKHNVTAEEFDYSVVWYGANLDKYIEIYDKVITRLQEEDNTLLALMNNQKDMHISMTRSGDTVNIWNKNSHYIFEGKLNNNLLTFTVPFDDNFKEGDIIISIVHSEQYIEFVEVDTLEMEARHARIAARAARIRARAQRSTNTEN